MHACAYSTVVPIVPTGLRANVLGPTGVHLTWDVPTPEVLLGDAHLYYVILENGAVQTVHTNLTLRNSPLLTQGETNVIEVSLPIPIFH